MNQRVRRQCNIESCSPLRPWKRANIFNNLLKKTTKRSIKRESSPIFAKFCYGKNNRKVKPLVRFISGIARFYTSVR